METYDITSEHEYVSDLLKYLHRIINCEATIAGVGKSMGDQQKFINSLCIPEYICEPVKPKPLDSSIKELLKQFPQPAGKRVSNLFLIGGGMLFTLIVPLGIAVQKISEYGLPFSLIITSSGPLLLVYGSISLVMFALGISTFKKEKQNVVAKHAIKEREYEQEMIEYRALLEEEKKRIESERKIRSYYELQLHDLENLGNKANDNLVSLYSQNILHPKYQNLIAVTSFYDYFSTGRTASLGRSGDDPGAYNIYEDDVRIGKVINSFEAMGGKIIDSIGSMESSIRHQFMVNQHSLNEMVQKSNQLHSHISTQLGIMNTNQAQNNVILEEIANQERLRTEVESSGFYKKLYNKSGYRVR